MSTMVLVDQGIVYDRSDAVLRIGQSLNLPANGQWAALAARIAVPKPIRDWFYSDVISANRVSALASFAPNLDPECFAYCPESKVMRLGNADFFPCLVPSCAQRKWFGESDECRFMDDELEKRFLS